MIQLLNRKYRQAIAYFFLLAFYVSAALPLYAGGGARYINSVLGTAAGLANMQSNRQKKPATFSRPNILIPQAPKFIGGPSQPEMSSFKSVGTDNMVNLFTGDFSYNIPLLDVGGYPVNIYYSGNIGMEQEASWVGLGWNINPGSITRNTRGIPDDFDGTDMLTQEQAMKPNQTTGVKYSGSLEYCGIKGGLPPGLDASIGSDVGVSFNNYLGPALDVGLNGGVTYAIANKNASEKNPGNTLNLGLSLGGELSSRGGLTMSGQGSLTAKSFQTDRTSTFGVSLGTSYNSRVGIKELQITGQGSFNQQAGKSLFEASEPILATTISFARPTYIPTIRMPLINSSYAGNFKFTEGVEGISAGYAFDGYVQTSNVAYPRQTKPLVGYMYYQNAINNPDAVMDFTRLNDKEVTANTPVISAPEYAYDVFVIQGEGTGGSIRAYRNDLGYVRDNATTSRDVSTSAGIEIGPPQHYGGNFASVKTPSYIGDWGSGNRLKDIMSFNKESFDVHQNVYFRNPGEGSVIGNDQFTQIGGTDLVSFKLNGPNFSPSVMPVLQHFNTDGTVMVDRQQNPVITNVASTAPPLGTLKRSQVITFLTADEAARAGLDKSINSYAYINTSNYATNFLLPNSTGSGGYHLSYNQMNRSDNIYHKGHHISQINVTETNGKRYVYGIPVYNTKQTDFTFSVSGASGADIDQIDLGNNAADWMSPSSSLVSKDASSIIDGYYQSSTTPACAHSFLLTGLLSPDYVDVTGDGITEDDLGDAVKFNYTRIAMPDGTPAVHKWRTPLAGANFNPGNRTESKDDKGIVSYGERESWYMQSIESKTMVALFVLSDESANPRHDGKGVLGPAGGVDGSDNSVKFLDHISLYNKADLYNNGMAGAKPIKTVHFVYDYSLCNNSPDNPVPSSILSQGKLTLKGIYFTFNGQERTVTTNNQTAPDFKNVNQYLFSYANSAGDNPDYEFNAADRWGTYKSKSQNPTDGSNPLPNKTFPYSLQPGTTNSAVSTTMINQNAGAWALKKILLPSGGQIEVNYESDDYAYVQNKHAADMMQVLGLGADYHFENANNHLYDYAGKGGANNDYVFVKVPSVCTSADDVYNQYLAGQSQFAFRIAVNMPGVQNLTSPAPDEYLTVYTPLDAIMAKPYGVCSSDAVSNTSVIWMKVADKNGYSPFCFTALEYLMQQLPDQAYPGMSVQGGDLLTQFKYMISSMLNSVGNAFTNPFTQFQSTAPGFARLAVLNKCFVRLNDPGGKKYGGGSRVHSITLKDNWDRMTGQFQSQYGQIYDYTTTETASSGTIRTISSGVASYEPGIGGEENPFQTVITVENALPSGPTSYGTIEMPMLDAFFPSAVVGYSQVTVKSLADVNHPNSRSGIGRQVSNFYTAKDFPVQYAMTQLDHSSDLQEHDAPTTDFFYQSSFDSRAISQGFLITTNDMHGKLHSQVSYAANDPSLVVNYTENFYTNTGKNGMNDQFNFVNYKQNGPNPPGSITKGNMGIDAELMTDLREFSVDSHNTDLQVQAEWFTPLTPFPFPWPTVGESENVYRAVTTTKLVNYHSMVDHVVVIDKGSQVTTQNLVYDSETGGLIVNQTNNEFNKPIYTTTYPAYWAYSGMGPAYQNIDAVYTGVGFSNGVILAGGPTSPADVFESGDELLILPSPTTPVGCDAAVASGDITKGSTTGVDVIWAFNTNKGLVTTDLTNPSHTSLTDNSPNYVFIDATGKPYTNKAVSFRIIRSGKRNMLDAHASGITTMASPVVIDANNKALLSITGASQALNASAMEYCEKWQAENDVINKFTTVTGTAQAPLGSNLIANGDFEKGNFGFTSGYTYLPQSNSPTYAEGVYGVTSNPASVNTDFNTGCTDHTTQSGNMMVINAATVPNTVVWSETVSTNQHTDYEFSMWAQSITGGSPANLIISINGTEIGNKQLTDATCQWGTPFTATWNSGTNTSAQITIIDVSTNALSNDFAIDDIFLGTSPTSVCTAFEQQDCNGDHLEKNINPYRKGLLGNFTPYRNVVFYSNRAEAAPTPLQTNLPLNGTLANFIPYWSLNNSGNLIPVHTSDEGGSQYWVWNSKTTRKNAKGQELENKNALGIYTSAQYGYNKTLPIAITNNGAYSEGAYEGFEDNSYKNSLNNSAITTCTNQKHIDFSTLPNTTVLSTDGLGFNAHSGKYVMRLNKPATGQPSVAATKTFGVASNNANTDFKLPLNSVVQKGLATPGGTVTVVTSPDAGFQSFPVGSSSFTSAGNGGYGVNGIVPKNSCGPPIGPPDGSIHFKHSFRYTVSYYVEVYKQDTYSFNFSTHSSSYDKGYSTFTDKSIISVTIKDLDGNFVPTPNSQTLYYTPTTATTGFNFTSVLCPRIYTVNIDIFNDYDLTIGDPIGSHISCGNPPMELTTVDYSYAFTNLLGTNFSPDYHDVVNQCNFVTAMKGDPTMLNPIFTMPSDKEMVLSAWVRQDKDPNDNTPYPPVTYGNNQDNKPVNNQLQISFTDASNKVVAQQSFDINGQSVKGTDGQIVTTQTATFTPTGPVIDGWQQYQCYFQAPSNAANMALNFVNNTSGNIYFDDIRLHPFNANMKSYVYDPITQRLVAELDANNYATFYEYDGEGTLIRTKAETKQGIKTIKETRSAKQQNITAF